MSVSPLLLQDCHNLLILRSPFWGVSWWRAPSQEGGASFGSALGNGCPTRRGALSLHSSVAVRKRLQNLGKSKVLLLDQDLLRVLLPDGDLEQTLLVEVVGDALVVRRETSQPIPLEAVEAAVAPSPMRELNV